LHGPKILSQPMKLIKAKVLFGLYDEFEGVKKERFERKVKLFGLKEREWKVNKKFMKVCE